MRRILRILLALTLPGVIAGASLAVVSCVSNVPAAAASDQSFPDYATVEKTAQMLDEKSQRMDPYILNRLKGDWLAGFLAGSVLSADGTYKGPGGNGVTVNLVQNLITQLGFAPSPIYDERSDLRPIWAKYSNALDEGFGRASRALFNGDAQLKLRYFYNESDANDSPGMLLTLIAANSSNLPRLSGLFNSYVAPDLKDPDKVRKLVYEKFGYSTSAILTYALEPGEKAKGEAGRIGNLSYALAIGRYELDARRNREIKLSGDTFSKSGDAAVYTNYFSYYGRPKPFWWLPDSRRSLVQITGEDEVIINIDYEIRFVIV